MRLFKRERLPNDGASIDGFWRWWATERDRVAVAIADRALDSWVEPISERVNAIDHGLAWELSAGSSSQHALVVSPEGDPSLRRLALAWLAAAPAADAMWEYFASRQPGPLGTLKLGEVDIDLASFRAIVSWDESRERVDVRLWHPALEGAPKDLGMRAAFLFLDNLLGEDDVERWIGSIDVMAAPTGGRTPDELQAEIESRAATATGHVWTLATINDGREESIAAVNLTVKPIDHPDCRYHVVVTVARGIEHLAGSGESEELNAAEDRLAEMIATAGGVHLGRVTARRERRIYFMCPDANRAKEITSTWAATERRYDPRTEVEADPRWDIRRALGM